MIDVPIINACDRDSDARDRLGLFVFMCSSNRRITSFVKLTGRFNLEYRSPSRAEATRGQMLGSTVRYSNKPCQLIRAAVHTALVARVLCRKGSRDETEAIATFSYLSDLDRATYGFCGQKQTHQLHILAPVNGTI